MDRFRLRKELNHRFFIQHFFLTCVFYPFTKEAGLGVKSDPWNINNLLKYRHAFVSATLPTTRN